MQTLKLISVLIILCIGHSIHATEVDIFKGMKLYAENCAGCHICLLYTSPSPRDH